MISSLLRLAGRT